MFTQHFLLKWTIIALCLQLSIFAVLGEDRNSQLIKAVQHGDRSKVESLLHAGADINAKNADGYDLVALALDLPTPDIAVYLLRQGAPAHGINPLMVAAMTGNIEQVKQLVEQEGTKVNVRDEWDNSAMSYAVQYGRKKIVDYLVRHDVDINERTPQTSRNRPYSGSTVLFCVSDDHPEMVAFLKSRGINVEHEDDAGFPALYWATLRGQPKVVHALIDAGADVNQICANSRSILSSVLMEPQNDNPDARQRCIQILKKAGAKLIDRSRPAPGAMD